MRFAVFYLSFMTALGYGKHPRLREALDHFVS